MRSPADQLRKRTGEQANRDKKPGSGNFFKYYIHDAAESCRLQLIGDFTQTQVPELRGCWQTARTTLGRRTLILDLRRVTRVDEAAKQWIAVMSQEGATCWPEGFLRTWLGAPDSAPVQKQSAWARLFAFLRGIRVPAVE